MPCWEANAMNAVKARIRLRDRESDLAVPILVPDLAQVRRFASDVTPSASVWKGKAFGWEVRLIRVSFCH